MTIREQLNSIAEKRILILDGAMGSLIKVLNLDEKSFRGETFADHPVPLEGCNDLLCLTRPGAIAAIHDTYLEAGADIIETCSFNSTSISLSDYGLGDMAYKISAAAAEIARKSADKFSSDEKPRFVAGSIGPTAKGASLYPDINDPGKRSILWDELESAFYDNARGLLDGGADILLVETVFDTLNAKAALFAINRLLEERRIDVPIMISATITGESGRLLSGQNLEAFCASVLYANPWSVGLNCFFNAQNPLPHLRLLAETLPCFVSAYPNAGLPNQFGRYEETPDIMAADIEKYFEEGLVNIIGGCCGSTPAHIAAIAKKAAVYEPRSGSSEPRRVLSISHNKYFSGLEPLCISDNTIHLTDETTEELLKDKEELLRSINKGEYEEAADIARDIIEQGEDFLFIAADDVNNINKFLDYALMNPYVAKAPFLIYSLSLDVIEAGLKRIQGRGLAGPVNLKDGKEEFIKKARLILRYGAAALITLIDEQGKAETFERKIEIAGKAYQLLKENEYPGENIVFYPDSEAREDAASWIRVNCPGVIIAL
jgi:5-methyltetrahydrofolate--homocysteine methyltransferase